MQNERLTPISKGLKVVKEIIREKIMPNTNGEKRGWFFQWITIMLTVIGMNSVSIVYIGAIKERVAVVETRTDALVKDGVRAQLQIDTLSKIITDGMTMRVVLQADAVNMKKQLDRIEDIAISNQKMLERHLLDTEKTGK